MADPKTFNPNAATIKLGDKTIWGGDLKIEYPTFTPVVTGGLDYYSTFILNAILHLAPQFFNEKLFNSYTIESFVSYLSYLAFPDAFEASKIFMPQLVKYRVKNRFNLEWIENIQMSHFSTKVLKAAAFLGIKSPLLGVPLGYLNELATFKKTGKCADPIIPAIYEEFVSINPFKNG